MPHLPPRAPLQPSGDVQGLCYRAGLSASPEPQLVGSRAFLRLGGLVYEVGLL